MSGFITSPAQIWLVVEPVDMRRGMDGLSSIVQQALGESPCTGSAFVFRNRAGNRLRLLLWDGNGVDVLRNTPTCQNGFLTRVPVC